ncbi:MAG: glycosyl hydrolase 2 galactose-binding domain-containing protein [Planctomycetota bacterium]
MTRISLNGPWTLTRVADGSRYPAQVPGCAWTDLLRAGAVPDVNYRDNEATQQWIGAEAFSWQRDFDLDQAQLSEGLELVCDGLDTLATVSVNEHQVLHADNMFRTWRVPVAGLLRPGRNSIRVHCDSTLPYLAQQTEQRRLREWNIYQPAFRGRGHLRKMACSYGWDWGPMVPTCGIWRSIYLNDSEADTIADLHIRQEHQEGAVQLLASWRQSGPVQALELELLLGDAVVHSLPIAAGQTAVRCTVPDPQLWWPNGMGAQPLYTVRLRADDRVGCEQRIGLRRLELIREPDAAGESFVFRVNGRDLFCKGANWVPLTPFPAESDGPLLPQLLDDAVAANMNMLRVWGGGLYESDAFYDGCDERGLLVWQDCAFACGAYPLADADFRAQVAAEIADNASRLRHHPSLALWCGNNELEMGLVGKEGFYWPEYLEFFDELLPAWIRAVDPDTPYWPSSPHTPGEHRSWAIDDRKGDSHHWDVFFGGKPIEVQRQWRCRFMSEYGFQSLPDRRTIDGFTQAVDRSMNSRIMDYHQRSHAGNRAMLSYAAEWLPQPRDFDDSIWLSQMIQSICVRYAAEHLRRLQPHSQGCLFWQINDVWPCPSWSSIDSKGRWKVLHYDIARAFAPTLVSLCEDMDAGTVALHCSHHGPAHALVTVTWEVGDTDGRVLDRQRRSVACPSQSDQRVVAIDLASWYDKRQPSDLLLWAWVADATGRVISRNLVTIARPKHLSLAEPGISSEVGEDESGVYVDLRCQRPALWLSLQLREADSCWDDNYFHLHPSEPRRIRLRRGPDAGTVGEQLRIHSLADLMPGLRASDHQLQEPPAGHVRWRKER